MPNKAQTARIPNSPGLQSPRVAVVAVLRPAVLEVEETAALVAVTAATGTMAEGPASLGRDTLVLQIKEMVILEQGGALEKRATQMVKGLVATVWQTRSELAKCSTMVAVAAALETTAGV